ncbi:MAG: 4Fe-4S dicluster domain-containing protein [Candidatus Hodarchaeales archaeon]
MARFRLIPSFLITRPMAYVGKIFAKKPFTMPDGDRRNKDTVYFPEELAKKGQTILDRDLSLSDVFTHTPHLTPNARGLIGMNIYNCTGCKLCARNCPNKCIEMVEADPQPPHWKKERLLQHPQIFVGRCMFCGICVESCRFDSLYHTPGFDGATKNKTELYHDYHKLFKIYQLYYPEKYKQHKKEYEEEYGSFYSEDDIFREMVNSLEEKRKEKK